MNFINYFFEIVVPHNVKDVPYALLSKVLIDNKNYEKEVKEVIKKSNEISKKFEAKSKLSKTILVDFGDIP